MTSQAIDEFPESRDLMSKYIVRHRNRCRRIANMNRLGFRATGVLVLILSAGLPALTAFEFPQKNLALSVVALSIAALSGLRGFYKWDEKWHLYRMQEFLLTRLILQWEIELTRIFTTDDIVDKTGRALARTEEFIKAATDYIENEVNAFFSTISWLELK